MNNCFKYSIFGQNLSSIGAPYKGMNYPFSFNGKEKDNELKGEGNSYDFGARIYDPRINGFFSIDPYEKKYPFWSPYIFAGGNPIKFIDENGKGPIDPVTGNMIPINLMTSTFWFVYPCTKGSYTDEILLAGAKIGNLYNSIYYWGEHSKHWTDDQGDGLEAVTNKSIDLDLSKVPNKFRPKRDENFQTSVMYESENWEKAAKTNNYVYQTRANNRSILGIRNNPILRTVKEGMISEELHFKFNSTTNNYEATKHVKYEYLGSTDSSDENHWITTRRTKIITTDLKSGKTSTVIRSHITKTKKYKELREK